jgi:hypothetical protein
MNTPFLKDNPIALIGVGIVGLGTVHQWRPTSVDAAN